MVTAPPLSAKQEALLDAIRDRIRVWQRAPTFRELMEVTGISSTSVVEYNLLRLVEKGLIEIDVKLTRSIRLVIQPGDPCPFCGGHDGLVD